jgi:hypothetical protein
MIDNGFGLKYKTVVLRSSSRPYTHRYTILPIYAFFLA